jgi:hypothetical protein
MMADTDIVINGLYHLVGRTASVVICGLDCGDYVVQPGGFVTVPIGSDPDGLLSGAYIQSFDVGPYDTTTYGDATTQLTVFNGYSEGTYYVPVVVGFTFTSVGQLLRPATAQDTKSPQGPRLGKIGRNHYFAVLLQNANKGVSFGTKLTNVLPANLRPNGSPIANYATLFSGVFTDTLGDGYGLDNALLWVVTRPYPCSVVAISGYLETAER